MPSVPTTLPFLAADDDYLDIGAMETWLWDAACAIRGAADAPKFKDFILPLVFYRRLSDVFDDEFARFIEEYGDEATARNIIQADHEDALKSGRAPILRFYQRVRLRASAFRHGDESRVARRRQTYWYCLPCR